MSIHVLAQGYQPKAKLPTWLGCINGKQMEH